MRSSINECFDISYTAEIILGRGGEASKYYAQASLRCFDTSTCNERDHGTEHSFLSKFKNVCE